MKTLSQVKKECWKVFSEYIRRRDDGKCFTCDVHKHWKQMQAGHYVRRSAGNSLYFNEINVNCQCVGCNMFKQGNADEYALRLQAKYGDDILQELNIKKYQIKKFTIVELEQMKEEFKEKIKCL